VIKIDEKYVEIGQLIMRWASPYKGDLLVYAAAECNGRKEGLYVFKKQRGSMLVTPGTIFRLDSGPGGVTYQTTASDPKTLSWEEIEKQFK
jgi:hypothetical protein